MLATKVSGKTLGLVGMGRIAKAVAKRAHFGFGMNIIFYDPYPPPKDVVAALEAQPCETLEDVFKDADVVSVHCPAGKETHYLINAERLALMKPTAFLINTSRGDVVDEKALVKALQDGTIAGAALDVYENEPQVSKELLTMENVVLFPHLGSASRETRVAMGMRALENVKAFFAGETPRDKVV
jgi:lactate dehydrogenase-like 2-hydroxyacid dehydrogenase